MLLVLLWIHVIGKVCSEVLPPLQDVHIDSMLRWSPAPEHNNVTYTVQYLSFDAQHWQDVPACVQTKLTSCDVTVTKSKEKHGCVKLRVLTKKLGLTSTPVEACSKKGDSCSPRFNLTSRPGFLTVHLSRNHSLALRHADHAKHKIYYGKEGQDLQKFRVATSSESIRELEEGVNYCVRVQFIYHDKPLGPPGCTQCTVIPESGVKRKYAEIIGAVVAVVFVVTVSIAIAYMIIFQSKRIKQWLGPLYQMPEFILQPLPEDHPRICTSPCIEDFDRLSFVSENKDVQGA
ncbi:uncharacterized protein LOC130120763 isoform X2 [Lampris incognitus]|uniref:uncharacterized protein LOC130120763 isoform X2 n=1 Tax=Lampris incognitus TaxID=2546036 RepID=UPI0024B55BBE|nr:uncharacterized protein LOC130120763 isoform X2 [Lampris incognitus]